MSNSTEVRQARRRLSSNEARIISILDEFEVKENGGFFAEVSLCEAVKASVVSGNLNLITFSCLGSIEGKEELRPGIFDTFFFRDKKKVKTAIALLGQLNAVCPSTLTVFLPDMEPRRTWGWSMPQDEISFVCEVMKEESVGKMPPCIKVGLWSEIDDKRKPTFEDVLMKFRDILQTKNQSHEMRMVSEEIEHLKKFGIRLPLGISETALRQVSAYAREGLILSQFFPTGILVQSEYPVARKDQMFQSVVD